MPTLAHCLPLSHWLLVLIAFLFSLPSCFHCLLVAHWLPSHWLPLLIDYPSAHWLPLLIDYLSAHWLPSVAHWLPLSNFSEFSVFFAEKSEFSITCYFLMSKKVVHFLISWNSGKNGDEIWCINAHWLPSNALWLPLSNKIFQNLFFWKLFKIWSDIIEKCNFCRFSSLDVLHTIADENLRYSRTPKLKKRTHFGCWYLRGKIFYDKVINYKVVYLNLKYNFVVDCFLSKNLLVEIKLCKVWHLHACIFFFFFCSYLNQQIFW